MEVTPLVTKKVLRLESELERQMETDHHSAHADCLEGGMMIRVI